MSKWNQEFKMFDFKKLPDFPGGWVVKNPPANVEDMG